jgi:hypothetical protein
MHFLSFWHPKNSSSNIEGWDLRKTPPKVPEMIGAWKSKPSFWKKMCSLAKCLNDSMGFFNGIPWDSQWDSMGFHHYGINIHNMFFLSYYIYILFGIPNHEWCISDVAFWHTSHHCIIVSLYHIISIIRGEWWKIWHKVSPEPSPESPRIPAVPLGEFTVL